MSQTTQNSGASEHPTQGNVEPLTAAQARKGLIEAAKQGLVDGTEINESWYLSLRNEVRNMVRASHKKPTKESKKDKKKSEEKGKTEKKFPAAISGLQKYLHAQKEILITPEQFTIIDGLKSVDECKKVFGSANGSLRGLALTFVTLMTKKERISPEGKANPGDGTYMASFKLDEHEVKSARTWDPHFFQVRPKVSGERSKAGDAGGDGESTEVDDPV